MESREMNRIKLSLPVGAGKAKISETTHLQRLRPINSGGKKRWMYFFTREEVEAGDLTRVIDTFGIQAKGNHGRLRRRIVFRFVGFDQGVELYEDQSVRDYLSSLLLIWPCWLYFAAPEELIMLQTILCCSADDLTAVREKKGLDITISVREEALRAFVKASVAVMLFLQGTKPQQNPWETLQVIRKTEEQISSGMLI